MPEVHRLNAPDFMSALVRLMPHFGAYGASSDSSAGFGGHEGLSGYPHFWPRVTPVLITSSRSPIFYYLTRSGHRYADQTQLWR